MTMAFQTSFISCIVAALLLKQAYYHFNVFSNGFYKNWIEVAIGTKLVLKHIAFVGHGESQTFWNQFTGHQWMLPEPTYTSDTHITFLQSLINNYHSALEYTVSISSISFNLLHISDSTNILHSSFYKGCFTKVWSVSAILVIFLPPDSHKYLPSHFTIPHHYYLCNND